MEKKKEDIFKAFTAKAVQRLKDKKVTKYETLYVPSIDQNIKIRNLNYPEIVECTEIDDKQDPNASDKLRNQRCKPGSQESVSSFV